MAVEAYLPNLITVVLTAAIDSINPCAIGVLILMVSVLIASKKSVGRMLFLGGLYIAAVFTAYLAAGIGLMYYFATLPQVITEYISIGVGALVILAGVLEIKDFFWYGKWVSLAIPYKLSKKIHVYAQRTTVLGVIILGVFVSAVELPCTGGPYLAIITLLSQNFDFAAFIMLIIYNVIFVLPLIIILLLVASGKKLQEIKKWKQSSRPYMRLLVGLLLIGLGWLLMLIANGTINFA